MDYTAGTEKYKQDRAKKQMLWFGIISLCMTFAGLTSAYIVSMERKDWLDDYEFPQSLIISTVVIILSSIAIQLAKGAIVNNKRQIGTLLLIVTLVLGLVFMGYQYQGLFTELTGQGYFMTGASSNITTTFLFLIVAVHIAHVIAGVIALITVVINHIRGKYSKEDHLGLTLGVTFWHFLGVLWIFLFLLLYFTK
ncbi:cytochrome oxidase subunit III [Dokdonia pacifica]|uniref:Cytochrome c oxidase subunit 3 n=1 Tax=Dokdonia pacifica TaxID=1627892 RepID=A0A238VR52_9FLAO|nr:cytochrome c oxidase subunit 3 [Dokdonia pacifica]GGG18647.1 cytochrome oxidase subunit III [Dokdonia pacifica]SNR36716.1 cytochrome c oxidase subunit 3 [Dokdonia pacifica]